MRRKGQAPFGRRAVSSKLVSKSNHRLEKKLDGDSDFLYNSMHQVVTDGMNHITQTLMQGRSDLCGNEYEKFTGPDGDLVNRDGELQTYSREDIPLRQLTSNNGINSGGVNGRSLAAHPIHGGNRYVNQVLFCGVVISCLSTSAIFDAIYRLYFCL